MADRPAVGGIRGKEGVTRPYFGSGEYEPWIMIVLTRYSNANHSITGNLEVPVTPLFSCTRAHDWVLFHSQHQPLDEEAQ